ncbi:MAG TPA: recombinase family protein [Desulfobacterales bacterium]|nr:recombinase family protein [Desulfobacterales bacterium]
MNDFSNNYRSGKDKRFERTRRPYGINQYNGFERRTGNDKKRPVSCKTSVTPGLSSFIEETVAGIKSLLENINESQKRVAAAKEEVAEAEKRKADMLESIAGSIKQMMGTVISAPAEEIASGFSYESKTFPPQKINASDSVAVDRQKVIDTIRDLRSKEMSYEKIAQQLESLGLPTFSGKGKWRGQTVHRLLNDFVIAEVQEGVDQPT